LCRGREGDNRWQWSWKFRSGVTKSSFSGRPPCAAIFDTPQAADELAALEKQAAGPDFWKDPEQAQQVLRRRRRLQDDHDLAESLRQKASDLEVLVDWAGQGEDVGAELEAGLDALAREVDAGEIKKTLGGEHDDKNAILTIHPGAGGTESQDWAEMLARAYLRWAERRDFKTEIIEWQPGDEAGVKAATMTVTGEFAYGLLLAEAGVHRLVRISPFDQAARRHTSFASVYIWPELPEDVDVEVDEKDLRIDTYRSSGAGGQHVNVTDSAVRITHLPTNIVVSCQNERSQHRNRDAAMKVLKAKLFDRRIREQQDKLEAIGGEKKAIDFGSQIRNYVLHPYQMVKDLRTQMETGNVERVLDGDFDPFIKAFLMHKAAGSASPPSQKSGGS
jgi:peptide chain release factor 2